MKIKLKNISQNNLKNISVEIPKNKLVVITGVSGSGKSSLAFDVINKEGQRQYFTNFSAQSRKYLGKLSKPQVEQINGLTPTISLSQNVSNNNPRSTVGTLSDIYDYLRLLFARLGKSEIENLKINRSLFSFNSPTGACENCKGLGVEDKISVDLLVEDENRSIRNQALKITNPNGYTIYSQVTIDALNQVCNAHGFDVDIAWKDLTDEQKYIILYGSDKIIIPYGKHSLESRMKWSGITAKPRPEGFYKGIIPVMEEILIRDRNPNILRFAKTQKCSKCNGSRLSNKALSVKINNKTIYEFAELSLDDLGSALFLNNFKNEIAQAIITEITKRINILQNLGLGYLSLNRQSSELSGGELQGIRLARQVGSELRNITFVFDEPSIGVHPANNANIIKILRKLVDNGNTVIVVEHDAQTILSADWIIDIGPKAGLNGGELIFNGSTKDFFKPANNSLTKQYLNKEKQIIIDFKPDKNQKIFSIKNAEINNLKKINVDFKYNQINCVTGISGAGKSSLINQTLIPLSKNEYSKQINAKGNPQLIDFNFNKLIVVNQSPIGKTVRSTPATYTKLHDLIRDFYAKLDKSKQLGFTKSTFSYNAKGGRCEKCQGAGRLEIGMHFLGNVESICDVCDGKRYNKNVLEVKYNNKNISNILDMSVAEALEFFANEKKIAHILQILSNIGLGYLKLGQSSNTLSGGEAQRIKLATELAKSTKANNLFVFDEPTTGLHFADIQVLLNVFIRLIEKGNTIILIEHNEDVIRNSHNIIDLGIGSGNKGGTLVFNGDYTEFLKSEKSVTAKFLKQNISAVNFTKSKKPQTKNIVFKGITTNNLKNISVEIVDNKHTVITGCSGSGKSSLAFDTIFVEAQNRFTESFPAYVRQFASLNSTAQFEQVKGLTPVIALKQNNKISDPRSSLGTLTEISDLYRLLLSRFGTFYCLICKTKLQENFCQKCNKTFVDVKKASAFSVNNSEGVCENCSGLGTVLTSDINLLTDDFSKSFFDGALKKHKSLNFYTDIYGQYLATLKEVGKHFNIDYNLAVKYLSDKAIELALFGSKDIEYNVEWEFKRNKRTGKHSFKGKWQGFVNLLLDEYYRKHANGKGEDVLPLLKETTCKICNGQKFKPEILSVKYRNLNIAELSALSVNASLDLFCNDDKNIQTKHIVSEICTKLKSLKKFGLGYLSIDRKSRTLSGGELQRVLLSNVLTGSLTGVTYILDEPTTGLHPFDVANLIENIKQIIAQGNTVISVEHNIDFIKSADNIIELGPNAGADGGKIVSSELKIKDVKLKIKDIKLKITYGEGYAVKNSKLKIKSARANNLKHIDVEIELNKTTAITGLSGTGKTSLMRDVLYKSFKNNKAENCDEITNLDKIKNILWIDKSSIDKNSQSVVSTFVGIFDEIRKIFVQTEQAKQEKLKATDFSFNNKAGQCSACKGVGKISVSLDFISDISSVCETCKGKRYKDNVLKIEYLNKNISEILELTIDEAREFFKENKKIFSTLEILQKLGLGYLKTGQSTNNLSGGEAQRLKLAKELLHKNLQQNNIYIFDEPSKGLHINDLHYLTETFDYLIKQGNTVVFIEHNPYLIISANNIIDLGHEGGKNGGELIYQGNLQGVLDIENSKTGWFLKMLLEILSTTSQ